MFMLELANLDLEVSEASRVSLIALIIISIIA